MIPGDTMYGFATFNLTGETGYAPPMGTAYGHIGVRAATHCLFARLALYNIEKQAQSFNSSLDVCTGHLRL